MQFLEMKRVSAWEICLMFGVPPSKLGVNMGMSNTYANLESDNTAYVQDALLPVAARVEDAVDAALPAGQNVKINMNQLMRADTAGRFSAYATAIGAGFMTVDEVRALEDLPPLSREVAPAAAAVLDVVAPNLPTPTPLAIDAPPAA